jgi:hypothetical protein
MNVRTSPTGWQSRPCFAVPKTLLQISARLFLALFTILPFTAHSLVARSGSTGAIEGRIKNTVTGEYLNHARVAVKGSAQTVLTDSSGYFRISDVPAGKATLHVLFAGLDEQNADVAVSSGQAVQQDFALTSRARYGAETDALKLNSFVVALSARIL